MSEEVVLEGKEYVSSKRAADLSGYAQDYIGQLARSGQIEARRVGGLWYVLPDSLRSYKEQADEYTPTPPLPEQRETSSDSLVFFDGKDYVSSVRASKLTGYNQDYIGQLARSGKILSRQIGNRWYVDRASLLAHKDEKDGLLGAVQAQSVGLRKADADTVSAHQDSSGNDDLYFNYLSDSGDLLPALPARTSGGISELSDKHVLDLHSAKNRIEIQKLTLPTSTQITRSPTTPVTRRAPRPIQRGKKHGSVATHASIGALTIVIVLSLSFATFKDRAIHAFVSRSLAGESPSVEDASASAMAAFDTASNALEERFVPELQYERQD